MTRPPDKLDTQFEDQGSLDPPRLVGRLVRLLLAVFLLWGLFSMVTDGVGLIRSSSPPTHWTFWLFVLIGLHLTPYVVNIGFGKNWHRRPQLAVLGIGAVLIAVDLAMYGSWWGPPLGAFIWLWLVYFSAHLGFSFLVATMLATPGCEMRAFPHLWTILSGRSTREHYCPGPFDRIDRWEATRRGA